MKINRKELVEALEVVKPGLGTKGFIEQAPFFAFMGDRIITYNDEISISHPIDGMDLTGSIQASEFYTLLSKLDQDEIELEVKDSEVRLKSSRVRAGMTLHSDIKLPLEEVSGLKGWKKIPEKLLECMRFVSFSCSRNLSVPVLTSVYVHDDVVEASDNFRITRCHLSSKIPVESFMIPSRSSSSRPIEALARHNYSEMCQSKGWVHFRTESGTIFSCRVYEGKFPDTSAVFNVDGEEIVFPEVLDKMLDRASVFAKRDTRSDEVIHISLGDNKILVKSSSEAGWFEEESNAEYSSRPIEFLVNVHFMKEILPKMRKCILGNSRLKFVGEDWEHVIALALKKS